MPERIENCLKPSYDPKVTGRGMVPFLQNPDGSLTSFEDDDGKIVGWAPVGDDHVTQKPRMILNPDAEIVGKITRRIAANDGYCPCQPKNDEHDTRCPCIKFMTTGNCCCSLFVTTK